MTELTQTSKRRILFIIATTAAFLVPFVSSAVNIALPAISKEFGMDAVNLAWVQSAYLLSTGIFSIPAGRIADLIGRKKLFIAGMIIFSIASIFVAISGTTPFLLFSRVLQGLGSAMIFSTSLAIITSAVDPKERGKILGYNVAATYIGLSAGPFIGGLITSNAGWRSIFLLVVIPGIAVSVLAFYGLSGDKALSLKAFDYKGSILFAFAMFMSIYGFSKITTLQGMIVLVFGVLLFAAFFRYQDKLTQPLFNINLFRRSRVFTFSSLAALINYSATFSVGTLLSLYFQYIKGMSAQQAGLFLLAQPLIQAVFSPGAGTMSDRIGTGKVASAGMAFTTLALSLMIFIGNSTSVAFIVAALVILGFGLALFSSPNVNAIMSSVDKQYLGFASSISGTMRLTGQLISMGITMVVFSIYTSYSLITPEIYPQLLAGIKLIFALMTALCIFGFFISRARKEPAEN